MLIHEFLLFFSEPLGQVHDELDEETAFVGRHFVVRHAFFADLPDGSGLCDAGVFDANDVSV